MTDHTHFVCYPSATVERGFSCAQRWIEKGYRVMMMLDPGNAVSDTLLQNTPHLSVLYLGQAKFPGYYKVINEIVTRAFEGGADIVTCIGDDMDPPEQGAQEVAWAYFDRWPQGLGVMQPTGDPQGKDGNGVPASARICGSPVFGERWATRAHGGKGAFCSDYLSFYGDEDLHCYAERLGLLWNNPMFSHFHRHWSFGFMARQPYHERAQKNWDTDYATFQARRAAGFPSLVLT